MFWRKILLGVCLALNLALAWALVWGEQGLIAYRALKEDSVQLVARIKELDEKNLELSREIRLLQSDSKYIEQMIRTRLNFVRDNEILYIFPPAGDKVGAKPDEAKD